MPSSRAPAPDAGPVGPGPDDKRLRAAARLAVEVAREGERAEPREPAPAELRPVLRFTRLSAASYRVIHRVIDDDGVFRARVADAAPDEAAVGRVGWLWLHRPVGWLDDPALADGGEASEAADDEPGDDAEGDRSAVAKHRRAARDAEAARRRAAEEATEAQRALRRSDREREALAARVAELEEARAAALRSAKALEAQLAEARRDLKVARRATREAEAELAAERARPADPAASPVDAPATPDPPPPPASDEGAAARAAAAEVAEAARAATELGRALARAAERLAGPSEPPAPVAPPPAPAPERPRSAARGGTRRRAARAIPALPPGVFDGSPDADRHLLGDPANVVLVDGYNLARSAWPGLSPEEERRRTVRLLEEVQARSGGRVIAVFDGDDAVSAPGASRTVRVRFSATGQTADDAIIELLDALAPEVPAVVVSSDRQVVRDARARGATPISSPAFLAAAGR